jgi:hypothetical protein
MFIEILLNFFHGSVHLIMIFIDFTSLLGTLSTVVGTQSH